MIMNPHFTSSQNHLFPIHYPSKWSKCHLKETHMCGISIEVELYLAIPKQTSPSHILRNHPELEHISSQRFILRCPSSLHFSAVHIIFGPAIYQTFIKKAFFPIPLTSCSTGETDYTKILWFGRLKRDENIKLIWSAPSCTLQWMCIVSLSKSES